MYSQNFKPVAYRRNEIEDMKSFTEMEQAQFEQERNEQDAHNNANTLVWTLSNGQEVRVRPVYDDHFDCIMYAVKIGNAEYRNYDLELVRNVPGVVAKVGPVGLTAERKSALEKMET